MTLTPVLTAAAMREIDRRTIEEVGIPGAVLMERAGLAAAGEILVRYPDEEPVAVVCGGGNNGGDGLVVARLLHGAGMAAVAYLTTPGERLRGDAARQLAVARAAGVPVRDPEPARLRRELARSGVIVDALLGTGASGAPRPEAAAVVEAIDGVAPPAVALDVPSGVDASTGAVAGAAVHAELTVTFHAPKIGLLVAPGRFHAGELVVADIGVPPTVATESDVLLADEELLALVPPKRPDATKYRAGAVLVVGGAPGFVGAPLLAATAALRAGAGIVWAAVPRAVVPALEGRRPELIVRPLEELDALVERADAVAVGPGLGREPQALELARRLAVEHAGPLVVDADGLFPLAGEPEALANRRAPAVLTPHEGELARLLGRESAAVRSARLDAVREAARRSGVHVLLKGADTLVAAPDGAVTISQAGVPALATAGTGDVLTGVVAAFLAKGLEPGVAATCAALAQGAAAARAAEGRPAGIIAGDVIDALPGVFATE